MNLEELACIPAAIHAQNFNYEAVLPYGLTANHIHTAMLDFVDFLGFLNQQLHSKQIQRFETLMMPAAFSGIVGEFVANMIPKHCPTLARNRYHNGHPDLVPAEMFPNNAVQYSHEGVEIKASRYLSGWQGHNPEQVWLMVFMFDCNRPSDIATGILPKPFHFLQVLAAPLQESDWVFSGRSSTSRRTITASVARSGYQKMAQNWIYKI